MRLAAAMEFFQAAALLHDDVMDGSDIRRGMPAAHRAFGRCTRTRAGPVTATASASPRGDPRGRPLPQWSDELYATSELPSADLDRGRRTFDTMRTQLMGGQYLDLLESARGWDASTPRAGSTAPAT